MRHFWMLFPLLFAFLSTEGEGGGGGGAAEEPLVPAGDAPETKTTAERALDFFTAPEDPAAPVIPEEPKPGDPAAPAEAKPGEPVAPAVPKPAEPAAPAVPAGYDPNKVVEKVEDFEKTLPFYNDATFQKVLGHNRDLSKTVQELGDIFNGGWREGGEKYAITDHAQLKGVLEDAFSLYDIGSLNMPVAAFMDIFSKNFPEPNVKAVLAALMKYGTEKGITAEMADQLNSPVMYESYKLRQSTAQNEQRNRQEQVTRELAEAKGKLNTHFNEFFAGLKVDPADEIDYLEVMTAKVNTDPALAKEIREGKYGNLDRILTEFHNRQVERDKKRLEQRTKELDARQQQIDKGKGVTPAGGAAAPTEVRKPKVNTADPELRRKAALTEFTRA